MKQHKPPFTLREMKLEVTHACPLACVHCSSDASPSCSREMTREDCTHILSQAGNLGVKKVAFSGGEPLIWSPIRDVVGHATSLGIEVSIYTSGNVDAQERTFRSLIDHGCNRFVFSMFGATATTHERVTRIRGSFQKTLTAIAIVHALHAEAEIHFVPFTENFHELAALAELGREKHIARISVLRFVPQGRGQAFQRHTLNQLQNLQLKRAIERLRAAGYVIRTGSPYNVLLLNDQPECCSGIDRLIVGPELDIYPCDAFKQVRAEEVAATADFSRLDRFTLRKCWEKSPFLSIVRGYLTTPFDAPCASCTALDQCLSGCLAQKVIAYGNFGKRPDPACLRGKG